MNCKSLLETREEGLGKPRKALDVRTPRACVEFQ